MVNDMVQTYNFVVLNHTRKLVILNLQHVFNPQCKGCREDLAEAKECAKQLGYQFRLNEPLRDPKNTVPLMTLITIKP